MRNSTIQHETEENGGLKYKQVISERGDIKGNKRKGNRI